MKFKKLLFGLAGFPLLLASCSNSMNWKAAKQWVTDHYKTTENRVNAIAEVEWNYSTTVGDRAKAGAKYIYNELKEAAAHEGIDGLEKTINLDKINASPTGTMRYIGEGAPLKINQLNASNFESIYKEVDTKNVYKVNGGSFSGTYNIDVHYAVDADPITATCIRVYNSKGYCTDFGFKTNKTIDKDNVIKVKFLAHFLLEE